MLFPLLQHRRNRICFEPRVNERYKCGKKFFFVWISVWVFDVGIIFCIFMGIIYAFQEALIIKLFRKPTVNRKLLFVQVCSKYYLYIGNLFFSLTVLFIFELILIIFYTVLLDWKNFLSQSNCRDHLDNFHLQRND